MLIPLYYGDAAEALKIAEEVRALDPGSDRCSPALALAVSLKALALAQIGSADASRAALDASGESFARLHQRDQIDSVFGFSERRWYFYRARTLAALGDFEHAWSAQKRALDLYPDDIVGDPTIIKLDRALCLLRENEIEEGFGLAADTLLNLPPEHRATIFLSYGEKLLDVIPKKYATHRAVSGYRAAVTETIKAIEVY
jgi:tetratricopeptide (TPR) repeat protein